MSSRKSLKMEMIKLCFGCHVVHKYNFIEIECFLYGYELNYTREVGKTINHVCTGFEPTTIVFYNLS